MSTSPPSITCRTTLLPYSKDIPISAPPVSLHNQYFTLLFVPLHSGKIHIEHDNGAIPKRCTTIANHGKPQTAGCRA
jgi:hypothetical protein